MAKYLLLATALGLSTPAMAQTTFADLLNGGAKKLSQAEVKTLVAGSRLSGPGAQGTNIDYGMSEDGKISGYLSTAASASLNVTGSWTVQEDGKLCAEIFLPNNSKATACTFYFQMGERHFAVQSDTDRGAPIFPRSFKR